MDDLKWIKKHYGEKMMHLCRRLFPKILETEGLLQKLLSEHFYHNRNLAQDIIDASQEEEFKSFLFSFVDVEQDKTQAIETKTAFELMDKAGYILYPECLTEKEIQSFRHWYRQGEEICTFRTDRLKSCRVWFAVKKNAAELNRADFTSPTRQDEYGTSVISIQFSRGESQTLSIKNRYNHTVNNCDNTFNSDLDNIIPGLTDAFERDFGVRDSVERKTNFELDGYVCVEGKYYKYNYELNNKYYCDDNIIIDNFQVKQLPNSQMLVDYFVFDFQNKTVSLYDTQLKDRFPETFGKIIDMQYQKNQIIIKVEDGEDIIIGLDNNRKIVSVTNNNLQECGDYFLYDNTALQTLSLPNLTKCGDNFLHKNTALQTLSLPNLTECGNDFLRYNTALQALSLPNLTECGYRFLDSNTALQTLSLPNLTKCSDRFLYDNTALQALSLPNLTECGNGFLRYNTALQILDLPNLAECGDDFLHNNTALQTLSLPNLTDCGHGFLRMNKVLQTLSLPNLTKCGNGFLYSNTALQTLNLPKLKDTKNLPEHLKTLLRGKSLIRRVIDNVKNVFGAGV